MTVLQPGDKVQMQTAYETLVICGQLGEGGQGVVYRAERDGRAFAVKWCRPGPRPGDDVRLRASLARLVASGRPPHPAFVWPMDLVASEGRRGFGYVMPLLEPRFISVPELLSAPDLLDFRRLAAIGLNLVDAFAALHGAGLCYCDISEGNIWVDRATGEVAIIDNDNVGVNGEEPRVLGTGVYIAPEVLRREAMPSAATDRYSLAVFLFTLFFFGHPLDGEAVAASGSWDGRRLSEEERLLKHFGRAPVFVFDPADDSNRPTADSPVRNWWPVYPRSFRDIFIHSFTAGLADPFERLAEGVLRKGLHRLADCVWECDHCQAALLYDPAAGPGRRCWNCGAIPEQPLLLTTPGHSIVLMPGAVVTGRHLRIPARTGQVLAVAEADQRYPGGVLLRNQTDDAWTVRLPGAEIRQVKPGQRLLARPLTVEVAGHQATIQRPGTEVRS